MQYALMDMESERGAQQLGWELEKLLTMTLQAMADCEDTIHAEMEKEDLE